MSVRAAVHGRHRQGTIPNGGRTHSAREQALGRRFPARSNANWEMKPFAGSIGAGNGQIAASKSSPLEPPHRE